MLYHYIKSIVCFLFLIYWDHLIKSYSFFQNNTFFLAVYFTICSLYPPVIYQIFKKNDTYIANEDFIYILRIFQMTDTNNPALWYISHMIIKGEIKITKIQKACN